MQSGRLVAELFEPGLSVLIWVHVTSFPGLGRIGEPDIRPSSRGSSPAGPLSEDGGVKERRSLDLGSLNRRPHILHTHPCAHLDLRHFILELLDCLITAAALGLEPL